MGYLAVLPTLISEPVHECQQAPPVFLSSLPSPFGVNHSYIEQQSALKSVSLFFKFIGVGSGRMGPSPPRVRVSLHRSLAPRSCTASCQSFQLAVSRCHETV